MVGDEGGRLCVVAIETHLSRIVLEIRRKVFIPFTISIIPTRTIF
jgi:hypothetical protein